LKGELGGERMGGNSGTSKNERRVGGERRSGEAAGCRREGHTTVVPQQHTDSRQKWKSENGTL
jgi:hypothetical protein